MVEANIALVWDLQSPLESAERVSTAERVPSLQYENAILIIYSFIVINNFLYSN